MKSSSFFLRTFACASAIFVMFAERATAQNFVLTNGWSIASGSQPYMTVGATERGIAYNPATGHLLLVSRASGLPTNPAIMVLDVNNGSAITNLDVTGVFTSGTSITFSLNMIRCTSDGVIYACNLSSPTSTATNNFIIYRWADESATPTIAFSGTIGSVGMRFGDSFDLRGSGVNTTIIAGQVNVGTVTGKAVAFFTTADGTNFSVNLLTNSTAANGDFQRGLAFATGDAYYSKNIGIGTVKYSTFNLTTTNASVLHTFTGYENNFGPMDVNAQSNMLAFIRYNTTASANQFVGLYTAPTDPSIAPTLMDTKYFPATTGNGNGVGSVDFGDGKVFALNTQNGLMAFDIVPSSVVNPPAITTQPASQTVYAGAPSVTFSTSVTGTAPFVYQWRHNGNNVQNATNASFVLSNIATDMAGSYSIVVSNTAAAVTSSDATLTVNVPFQTEKMTNVWNVLPNSRFYLSDSDNAQRGLAYNPATTNVLLLSRSPSNNIVVLASANGAEKHFLNVDPAIIASGTTFPLNAIGVAGDGIVYAANLVNPPTDSAASFRIYRWLDDSSNSVPELIFIGDPTGANLR